MPPKAKNLKEQIDSEDIDFNEKENPKVTQVVEVVEDEDVDTLTSASNDDVNDESPLQNKKSERLVKENIFDDEDDTDLNEEDKPKMKLEEDKLDEIEEELDEKLDEPEKAPQEVHVHNPMKSNKYEKVEDNNDTSDDGDNEDESKKSDVINELFENKSQVGYPEIMERKNSFTKTLIMWSVLVFLGALMLGALLVFLFRGSGTVTSGDTSKPAEIVVTETPIATPTAVVRDDLKRADITVDVLNGGGVKGAGATMKKALEDLGYKVGEVGNAEEYNYENTDIVVNEDKADYLELLKADLGKEYTIGTAKVGKVTGGADAQVIVGKN